MTDTGAAMAETAQAIFGDILESPELSDPEWDTYALVAEVTDNSCAMTAYRYTPSGPPVSTEGPENDDLFWDLRDYSRGDDGTTWDVVLIKIQRDTGQVAMNFFIGADADAWRITPENFEALPEKMRPRPEDFAS